MRFQRVLSTLINPRVNPDFSLFPDFFSIQEQRVLLQAALQRLDSTGSRRAQRKRKQYAHSLDVSDRSSLPLQEIFLPEEFYEFEEGHFDGVIHNYREMHLMSWPTSEFSGLSPILHRLHLLLPSQDTQTHLLHLASNGEILPHVDNVEASGSWILGVSLGGDRVLRMQHYSDPERMFEVLLRSGSVYIRKDTVRFQYKHSILKHRSTSGAVVGDGQRLSIMIRDRLSHNSENKLPAPVI
ncbi:hypothetical protein VKT23_013146 [Stygiomarasmius scandens]|uniref:Alpha-ketoglutarate-dependent dioxygenase AlkB-like domain-containing protein n=1 Tax=Marasmiellus scandens TaxID=2682957 RepID=A0ABR1J4B7_9AGAR